MPDVLRHLIATLAYRAAKVLRDAPPEFGAYASGATTRRPVQIVAHMGDLMDWALTLTRDEYIWKAGGSEDWDHEVERFFAGLAALDHAVARATLSDDAVQKLIQGPLSDALTHVGQLAMIRGAAGAAVRPESYARADIQVGRTGIQQAAPRREFDGDASARK